MSRTEVLMNTETLLNWHPLKKDELARVLLLLVTHSEQRCSSICNPCAFTPQFFQVAWLGER